MMPQTFLGVATTSQIGEAARLVMIFVGLGVAAVFLPKKISMRQRSNSWNPQENAPDAQPPPPSRPSTNSRSTLGFRTHERRTSNYKGKDGEEYRPMASSISSEVDFFPRFRTKSAATTIPTNLFCFNTGNLLILLLDISLAASLSEASGSIVMSDLDIISETLVSSGSFFATTLRQYLFQ